MSNISSKPKDESHDYGHGKYETLATSIVGIVLLCVGFGLFWEGANKIYDFYFKGIPLESPGMIALVAALISIVIKELLYHITVWVGRKQNSQVVIANAWHHRSDAFSSIGTALGIGGAILLGDNWRVLDPLAAVIVSLFIVKVALQLVIPAINDLLEKSLPKEVEDDQVVSPLKPVIRVATDEDEKTVERNKEKEKEAFAICKEKIIKHGLEMKLVDAEYTFDGNKLLFYLQRTAELTLESS